MVKEEVENLTAEERLTRLKKLKKEREKEIQEAEALMHEAEDEIKDKQAWEDKVPIPQVATRDTSTLSEEGKIIVKAQRGEDASTWKKAIDKKLGEQEERRGSTKKEEDLEESLRDVEIPPGAIDPGFDPLKTAYIMELSQVPMQNLYQEIVQVYDTAKESGYISQTQQQRLMQLSSAIEKKVEDADVGDYSMTKEAASAASASQAIAKSLDIMYHGNSPGKKDMSNWYDKN